MIHRWHADTIARYVEVRGEVVAPWEDVPEEAVFVRQLGAYTSTWQREGEDDTRPQVAAITGTDAAIVAWLRENGPANALEIVRSTWRCGSRFAVADRLAAMERRGALVRVGRGRYAVA